VPALRVREAVSDQRLPASPSLRALLAAPQ
jgi:hypothetical protein